MSQCCAILKIQFHYKKPLVERCQQKSICRIDDIPLCGIHLRSLDNGDLQVITTLKRNPPK
jgi:hypothetical protein